MPPKTCEIERLITRPQDIGLVLAGRKTATRRNGRYAGPGEIMKLKGRSFRITRVYRQTLGELMDEHAAQEGHPGAAAYRQSILSIYPGMPWLLHMKV